MNDQFKLSVLTFLFCLFVLFVFSQLLKYDNNKQEEICRHLGGRITRLGGEYRCIKKEIFNEVFMDLRRKNEAQ